MKVGQIYKAQYHMYDISDLGVYIFKIVSEKQVDGYYVVNLINTNYIVHFYPNEWTNVEKISSLEQELW